MEHKKSRHPSLPEWILQSGLEKHWIVDPDLDHPKVMHLEDWLSLVTESIDQSCNQKHSMSLLLMKSRLSKLEEESEQKTNHNVQSRVL